MAKNNILITFSGGRTSAFMAVMCKEYYKNDNLLFVFANTGKEREETLKFINECNVRFGLGIVWIEADIAPQKGQGTSYKVVDYHTASRKGFPFEKAIKKYGLPSKLYRHCTRELKEVPIHKYAKHYFNGEPYITALGIRADEAKRINKNRKNVIYPLVSLNIDEKFIRAWWKKQDFDLELKDYEGNCDLCFLKSKRKRLTILSEYPNIGLWWKAIENEYADEKRPMFDVRGKATIEDLVKMAQEPFERAKDKQELREQQGQIFDVDLDIEFSCFCENI